MHKEISELQLPGIQSASAELSRVEAIHRILKKDIIEGKRKPRELLRIDRMRQIYGVGPTPLREALQRLSADGWVIARDGRGFQVVPLSLEEFEDLNSARTEVELAALRLSIQHGAERWEARIVAASYVLEKADVQLSKGAVNDIDKWEAANSDFHYALLAACPSVWLLRTWFSLYSKCERYRRVTMRENVFQRRRDVFQAHKDLKDAVLARDTEKSCHILIGHNMSTVENYRWISDAAEACPV